MAKNIIDWQPGPASYIAVVCYWSFERTWYISNIQKRKYKSFPQELFFKNKKTNKQKTPTEMKNTLQIFGEFCLAVVGVFFKKKELDKKDVIDSAPQWRLLAPGVIFISVC